MIHYNLLLPIIILSGILYRVPRGTGLSFISPKLTVIPKGCELIWSLLTAGGLSSAFQEPLLLLITPLMIAGEAPGWSKWWPNNNGGNMKRLNMRGLLLLNPLMGNIYFWTYHNQSKLPKIKFLSGWTEFAELLCGFVTAFSYTLVSYYLIKYII